MREDGHADEDQRIPELFTDDQWRELASYLALPPRQLQIAHLLCRGWTNRQIASRLGISPHTVRTHLRALFERFEVRDRVGVVVRLVLADRQSPKVD